MAKSSKNVSLKTFVICENAFFSEDKKLNIIGIFDRIFSSAFPVVSPLMSLAGILEAKPKSSVELVFKFKNEKGVEQVAENRLSIEVSDSGKANFVIRTPGLILKAGGFYTFEVFNNKKKIGEATFELKVVREEKNNAGGKFPN